MKIIYCGKNMFLPKKLLEYEVQVPQEVYTFHPNIMKTTTGMRIFLDHTFKTENVLQKSYFADPSLPHSKQQAALQRISHIDFFMNEKPLPKKKPAKFLPF